MPQSCLKASVIEVGSATKQRETRLHNDPALYHPAPLIRPEAQHWVQSKAKAKTKMVNDSSAKVATMTSSVKRVIRQAAL